MYVAPYLNATPVLLNPAVPRHYSRSALAQKSLSRLPANKVTDLCHSGSLCSHCAVLHSNDVDHCQGKDNLI